MARWLRRAFLAILGLLVLAAAAIQLTGHGYFWTALRHTYLDGHNTAHIDDARNFPQAVIAGGRPQPWPVAAVQRPLSESLRAYLSEHRSAAFLVAHRGELIHETYFAPYSAESRTNGFSMVKTLTTLLAGAAVADGILPDFDAPAARWLPEYAGHPLGAQATLAQFSAMTSGHEWTENYYLPLNPTTELYFGGDAAGVVLRQGFERAPGTAFEYSSASTQVLAVALQRALRERDPGQSLSRYLSQRLWQPLGLADASWSLDRPREQGGMEMAYCCVHSRARDMARIGQLLLQDGQWNGQALLPAAFVQRITQPNGLARFYGHGLWMDPDHAPPFYFLQGHLGQYVIVVPSEALVIVRLGQYRTQERTRHAQIRDEVYRYVEEALRMVR
ncbi:serine hydrolase domain-containing protein [Hydrogenophaga electricum]|nr:serine hydrolase [Hydrogenophaga electricum]